MIAMAGIAVTVATALADLKGKTIAVNVLNSVGAGPVQMIGG